jgi:hypothetical protein
MSDPFMQSYKGMRYRSEQEIAKHKKSLEYIRIEQQGKLTTTNTHEPGIVPFHRRPGTRKRYVVYPNEAGNVTIKHSGCLIDLHISGWVKWTQ